MSRAAWALLGVVLALAGARVVAAEERSRTLIIALDAVPYATMQRVTTPAGETPGLFASFDAPVPLISTFPSSTSIALAGILGDLGLAPSPGYEARFFDWQRRRRRGGGPFSYFKVTFPWRQFFDWNRKGPVRNALHAVRPVRAGVRELRAALEAFADDRGESFSIYIADTDTVAHLHGPSGLDPILVVLDQELTALRKRLGSGLEIVLFSDHGLSGGERLRNVLPAVRRQIKSRGWRDAERLRRGDDVVLTPYGLVSSFEAYAENALVPALAGALAAVEGVDLCVFRTAAGWQVAAALYTVDFERRATANGLEWRWQTTGDSARGVASVLAAAGAERRWIDDERLLAATSAAEYPDPLYRLAGAFASVQNPASVLCSVARGYMFGARGTERSARWTKGALRWTHGALHREASYGFLMTDRSTQLPPTAVRYDRALAGVLSTAAPRGAAARRATE